ncbi:branched-chain amino acid ABC transporter permease [Halobacillus litoralis]|uniref:Branched-chain amino acid ABC transporter permease n=1 Tax=Halobacillus litoralis TaxID=45668 RepID=A0A845DW89_9BACI|nr:AzlC family ABC transporter permease [Halobacillus litoralis]MYL18347.1 branched-chain amino acid ABC transporter permease [Halobacillus litoralis]
METHALHKPHSSTRLHMVQKGIAAGFPIMLGYLPVALTYGVLAGQSGMSNLELTLMSVLVFAGAAQFLAVGMVAAGTGFIEIITATFVLNFRHFVMGLSFVNRLKTIALRAKLPLTLGLTDETFTVSALYKKEASEPYGAYFYASLMLTAYVSWVGGSFMGGVLGDVIPAKLSDSMGVALYAMFIGLLIPSVKRNGRIAIIAVTALLINALCQSVGMNQGWAIVAGTLAGGLSGIWLLEEEGEEE